MTVFYRYKHTRLITAQWPVNTQTYGFVLQHIWLGLTSKTLRLTPLLNAFESCKHVSVCFTQPNARRSLRFHNISIYKAKDGTAPEKTSTFNSSGL